MIVITLFAVYMIRRSEYIIFSVKIASVNYHVFSYIVFKRIITFKYSGAGV